MIVDLARLRLEPLTVAEQRALVLRARQSIARALGAPSAPPGDPVVSTATLRAPGAAFVSLHHGGRLRGCVGTLLADGPLEDTVARMAVAAAMDDPRFAPLTLAELPGVEVEISRLSALVRARPDDIVVGVHGVAITLGAHRAVFLPRVAAEQGWDRVRLLNELCVKATLPADAWQSAEAELFAFVAEVFGD